MIMSMKIHGKVLGFTAGYVWKAYGVRPQNEQWFLDRECTKPITQLKPSNRRGGRYNYSDSNGGGSISGNKYIWIKTTP